MSLFGTCVSSFSKKIGYIFRYNIISPWYEIIGSNTIWLRFIEIASQSCRYESKSFRYPSLRSIHSCKSLVGMTHTEYQLLKINNLNYIHRCITHLCGSKQKVALPLCSVLSRSCVSTALAWSFGFLRSSSSSGSAHISGSRISGRDGEVVSVSVS